MTALRDLPTHHRDVVALCVVEGFSEAEAATALGIPVGTVKSRLHRAKGTLARRLREQVTPELLTRRPETNPTPDVWSSDTTTNATTDSIEMSDSR